MDCDMLMLDDIVRLWALRDDRYAVMCVKHDHRPREETKFLGAVQTKYEKKNWSSVMLFNNGLCRALTPEYVNRATGLELHQFKWLKDEALIGAIPHRWNHLVGFDPPDRDVSLVHYTLGGPYFDEYRGCEYAAQWFAEREAMLRVDQLKA
jgi:lipopolysaccharide biosynthesis glycosyltransferase